jgi:hypothetical protein
MKVAASVFQGSHFFYQLMGFFFEKIIALIVVCLFVLFNTGGHHFALTHYAT